MLLKFRFLIVVQNCPLALAFSISTEDDIKLHFKHKIMYFTRDHVVLQTIPIKSITKYAGKDN
jgi:hypothetical protein